MSIYSEALDRVSGGLFLLGFVTSKLRSVPIVLLSKILDAISIIAYLIGYIAWLGAGLYYPDRPRKVENWYGFAQFKEQYQVAAILGIVATIFCIVTPMLIVPTAWLYTISNFVWAVSEYHKKHNVYLNDGETTSDKQDTYLRYAVLVTLSSIIAAVASTLVLIFPQSAFFVLSTSSVLGAISSIGSIYYWTKFYYHDFTVKHSYNVVTENLLDLLDNVQDEYEEPHARFESPKHYSNPFAYRIDPIETTILSFEEDERRPETCQYR